MSARTQRVHFHAAADGSRPLDLSIPLELLAPGPEGADEPAAMLWDRLRGACRGEQTPAGAAAPPMVDGIGLAALQPWVTAPALADALRAAQEFVAEWRELRAVHAARLSNTPLKSPLTEVSTARGLTRAGMRPPSTKCNMPSPLLGAENFNHCRSRARHQSSRHDKPLHSMSPSSIAQAVVELEQRLGSAGAYGVGTDRFMANSSEAQGPPPPGAEYKPVTVSHRV